MTDLFEKMSKVLACARGFLLKFKLQTLEPIKSCGRTMVCKNNGIVIAGTRPCLWPNVVLDLASRNRANPAIIRVSNFTSIGDRTEIHCADTATIGEQVLIAWDVNIIENDYQTAGGGSATENCITIEDEVRIGACAVILKGMTIGKRAIIGAESVITKSVPAYSLAAGWVDDMSSDFFMPILAAMKGYQTAPDPEAIGYYEINRSADREFRRKIRTVLHGLKVLFQFRSLLNPFKYGWFSIQIISHNLLRWLVPISLPGFLICNAALSEGNMFFIAAFAIHLLFYAAAATGALVRELKHHSLFKIPLFFVIVNLSIIVAWYHDASGH